MQGKRATIKTRDALVCSFCPTLRRFLCRCFCRLLNSKQGRLNSAGQGKGYSAQERVEVEDDGCCYYCLSLSAVATYKKQSV